jgi:uncharacterized membrane protein
MHSVRIYADGWRAEQISKRGENTWLGFYSLVSIIGFLLIIWGYGDARLDTQILWHPPVWTKHLAALLTLPAFILFVAAYVPGFGSFLLWAILDFRTSRRRDKAAGTTYEFISYSRDAIATVIGLVAWAGFAIYLHGMWIGVKPFG